MKDQIRKWLIKPGIMLIITVILLELSTFFIYPILMGESYSRSSIQEKLRGGKEPLLDSLSLQNMWKTDDFMLNDVIHPYLGYVKDPERKTNVNAYGLFGKNPVVKKDSEKLNVCIVGGSVAKQFYQQGTERLTELLSQNVDYKGKEIVYTPIAMGGYKQPQQLIGLNYLMFLGAEFDVVINIDGFNEIVLPYSENKPAGVNPNYPRLWNLYSRKNMDLDKVVELAELISIQKEREALKLKFSGTPFYQSNFLLMLYALMDKNKNTKVNDSYEKFVQKLTEEKVGFQVSGPDLGIENDKKYFTHLAQTWVRASEIINMLGRSEGFKYFHFLQPNQYVEGSKKLTTEENEIAYVHEAFAYKEAVQKGYGYLSQQGKRLAEEGINYSDLTMMFEAEKRSVYGDNCCHFNQLGYELIAEKIARKILAGK